VHQRVKTFAGFITEVNMTGHASQEGD